MIDRIALEQHKAHIAELRAECKAKTQQLQGVVGEPAAEETPSEESKDPEKLKTASEAKVRVAELTSQITALETADQQGVIEQFDRFMGLHDPNMVPSLDLAG